MLITTLALLTVINWISQVDEFALRVVLKLYVLTAPPIYTVPWVHPADADDIATSEPPPLPPVYTTVPETTNVSPEDNPPTVCLNFSSLHQM